MSIAKTTSKKMEPCFRFVKFFSPEAAQYLYKGLSTNNFCHT